ncbi:MAG: HAMP domain-containing protein [Deltaproteobacteria bacterium]|nr:HAMP domain-containing protein [Deltaproteobacteria bacterium]
MRRFAPKITSLGGKLIGYLLIGALALMGMDMYLSLERASDNLLTDFRSEVAAISRTVQLTLDTVGGETPEQHFDRLTVGISGFENVLGVAFYNREGRVVSLSASLEGRELPQLDVRQVIETRTPIEGLFADTQTQRYYRVGPIANPDGEGVAAFLIIEDLPLFTNVFHDRAWQMFATRLGLLIALAGIVSFAVRRNITQPFAQFAQHIEAIGQGRFDLRLASSRRDEIGRLAHAFDRMSARVEAAQQNLIIEGEEKLRLERALRHSGKLAALGQLASRLAHEIGTPLNVIQGRAEQLLQQEGLAEKERNFIKVIIGQIERISGFLRHLLTLARRPEPQLRGISLNDILRRVYDVIGDRAASPDVEVVLALANEEPVILGDPEQLEQVFLNLSVNAIQAVEPVGTVTLSTSVLADGPTAGVGWVEAVVADTGPGVHPEDLPRLFEPFFTTKGSDGSGLGLAISREIILNHQGEIRVESEPGRGARFIVSLPRTNGLAIASPAVTFITAKEEGHVHRGA